jgi:hypothetical protein
MERKKHLLDRMAVEDLLNNVGRSLGTKSQLSSKALMSLRREYRFEHQPLEAYLNQGLELLFGIGRPARPTLGRKYIQEGAKQGEKNCIWLHGRIEGAADPLTEQVFEGDDLNPCALYCRARCIADAERRLELLRQAGAKGFGPAHAELGGLFKYGRNPDVTLAFEEFEQAALAENSRSGWGCCMVGNGYLNGNAPLGESSRSIGEDFLRQAALLGHVPAAAEALAGLDDLHYSEMLKFTCLALSSGGSDRKGVLTAFLTEAQKTGDEKLCCTIGWAWHEYSNEHCFRHLEAGEMDFAQKCFYRYHLFCTDVRKSLLTFLCICKYHQTAWKDVGMIIGRHLQNSMDEPWKYVRVVEQKAKPTADDNNEEIEEEAKPSFSLKRLFRKK